jgi:hypothetical protein
MPAKKKTSPKTVITPEKQPSLMQQLRDLILENFESMRPCEMIEAFPNQLPVKASTVRTQIGVVRRSLHG